MFNRAYKYNFITLYFITCKKIKSKKHEFFLKQLWAIDLELKQNSKNVWAKPLNYFPREWCCSFIHNYCLTRNSCSRYIIYVSKIKFLCCKARLQSLQLILHKFCGKKKGEQKYMTAATLKKYLNNKMPLYISFY